MNEDKHKELDQVLEEYSQAAEAFDANVLATFLKKYPEHAQALHRYAHVQLTFVQPTREEVEAEELSDEEMLPRQSRLLQRMHELREGSADGDVAEACKKLASLSGETSVVETARVVFGESTHDEDLLLLSVTDSVTPVTRVPDWFYEGLGKSIGCSARTVVHALARNRQLASGAQRFSSQERPKEHGETTWERLVEDCISNQEAKKRILERSARS